jgi:choline/ethanolamine kinase
MVVSESKRNPGEAAPAPERSIPKEARLLLHELAAAWEDVADCRALEVVPLKGAMTNEVYQARWVTKTSDGSESGGRERDARKVLVRVYGEGVDLFFDREDEVRTFECMSQHGHGPRLLARSPNGRIEEFIHARVRIRLLFVSCSNLLPACLLASFLFLPYFSVNLS